MSTNLANKVHTEFLGVLHDAVARMIIRIARAPAPERAAYPDDDAYARALAGDARRRDLATRFQFKIEELVNRNLLYVKNYEWDDQRARFVDDGRGCRIEFSEDAGTTWREMTASDATTVVGNLLSLMR